MTSEPTHPATVLIVEDEPPMQRFLSTLLRAHGHRVLRAESGAEGIREAATRNPDVVLLDLGLPDMDGLDVVERLREWTRVPVIVLSARQQDHDKVTALDRGADDYLTKPFSAEELMARVRVALRHARLRADSGPSVIEVSGVRIDLSARTVHRDGAAVDLTKTEYDVLAELARHAGRCLTHAHILRAVWGPHCQTRAHYVRVQVRSLRVKLEKQPSSPSLILTETGVGYRFATE